MSGLLRPVGHLSASVYWVRRLLVLALLTVLVVLLFRVFGGDDDPRSAAAPAQSTPSVGPPGTPPPSSTPAPPTTQPTGDPTTEPVGDKGGHCAASDVRLVVMPAVRRLPAGRGMNLHVRMAAVRGTCTATVDPVRLVVSITSGRDRIWTTAHCIRTVSRATLVLTAGHESAITVPWDGRRSTVNCAPGQLPAKRGTYVIQGSYDGRYSTPQAFYIV